MFMSYLCLKSFSISCSHMNTFVFEWHHKLFISNKIQPVLVFWCWRQTQSGYHDLVHAENTADIRQQSGVKATAVPPAVPPCGSDQYHRLLTFDHLEIKASMQRTGGKKKDSDLTSVSTGGNKTKVPCSANQSLHIIQKKTWEAIARSWLA